MNPIADNVPQQPPPPPQPAPQPAPAPAAVNDPRRKSPALASFLSILPGLGQIYVGYYKQGFINILATGGIVSLLTMDIGPLIPLASIFLAFFWFYNIVDAGRRATFYNQALAGGSAVELPEDLETFGMRGSIAGGTTLVAVGFVLLLHTRFGVSLDWLEEWWPVAVIAFGGYLIYRAMRDRTAAESASYGDE